MCENEVWVSKVRNLVIILFLSFVFQILSYPVHAVSIPLIVQ